MITPSNNEWDPTNNRIANFWEFNFLQVIRRDIPFKYFFSLEFIYLLLNISWSFAQGPAIVWQKCYGGSGGDGLYSAIQTYDNGFVLFGGSTSNDGDVSGNHGNGDFWLMKIDNVGGIEWQKAYGGTDEDDGFAILQTPDSGYIFTGGSLSNDNDVTGNHGSADVWVVRTDQAGNIIWQKCFGGTKGEEAFSIKETLDGGYILCGFTYSNDGDVLGYHGTTESDIWVIKIDSNGNLLWQKCLGGAGNEGGLNSSEVISTSDSGFIVTGRTGSSDGDVNGNHGSYDYWVVKLNSNGIIQWQNCLGGSFVDQSYSILQSDDGGYLVAGYSLSTDNGILSHGGGDYWVVKLNDAGILQWQKCYGGSNWDIAYDIQKSNDGGFLVMGQSYSYDGDVVGHHGDTLSISLDYWLLKIDSIGNLLWQKCLGGNSDDFGDCVVQTSDSGYLVAGGSFSNDGDVSGNHGGSGDYWVAKLSSFPDAITYNLSSLSDLNSFFSFSNLHLSFTSNSEKFTPLQVFDITGRSIFEKNIETAIGKNDVIIPIPDVKAGIYFVRIGNETCKVISF